MQTTKSILIICSSSGWGGTEKNALLRYRELSLRGYDLHLATVSGQLFDRAAKENCGTLHLLLRGGDLNPISILRWFRLLKKVSPDVLFVTMNKDYWLGGLAGFLAKIPMRVMYLGIERRVKKTLKYKLIHRVFLPRIVVNSAVIKFTLCESPYVREETISVIRNGFTVKNLPRQVALKKQLGLAENTILIGGAGRLMEQKGFDLVPEVLAELADLNVHIAIAGEGDARRKIEEEAKTRGVFERLHLLGFQSDMNSFFQNIDLFALFSRSEGMANVLNEAMSFGVPVVSTEVSGVRELFKNGEFGTIVPVDDPRAMARAIREMLQNGFVESSRLQAHIEENYSISRMIDDTEAAFGLKK